MEHQVYFAGIGGQGIQLVAKTFALAAMDEGRHVLLNGFYGHEMRGGISRSMVAIGDAPLKSLPVAASVGAAVVLHANYWDQSLPRVRAGAVVLTDEDVLAELPPMAEQRLLAVPAARIAREVGNPMVMGMALVAAFGRLTGLARAETLIDAMRTLVPAYRRQHVTFNEQAILRGAEAAALAGLRHPLPLAPARIAA